MEEAVNQVSHLESIIPGLIIVIALPIGLALAGIAKKMFGGVTQLDVIEEKLDILISRGEVDG